MSIVTPDNQGPLVNVATWIALGPMVLTSAMKVYTKWETVRRFQLDDFYMVAATLLAIAQIIATSEQVDSGLGRNENTLTEDQVDSFFLCEYIAQFFYIITIFSAKLIGLQFFLCLAGPQSRKIMIQGLIYFILFWTGLSVFILSFQCHPPDPWLGKNGGCINKSAFWVFVGIIDIVTQLIVGLTPIFLLNKLQAKRSAKIFSMIAFTPNLLVIPFTIVRLAYYFDARSSNNYTWDSLNLALVTALHAIFSVIIAAIPFSKPMVDSMVMIPMAIPDEMLPYGASKSISDPAKASVIGTKRSVLESFNEWPRPRKWETGNFVNVSTARPEEQELQEYEARDGSQERIIREQKGMMIHQTKSTTVTSTANSTDADTV